MPANNLASALTAQPKRKFLNEVLKSFSRRNLCYMKQFKKGYRRPNDRGVEGSSSADRLESGLSRNENVFMRRVCQ